MLEKVFSIYCLGVIGQSTAAKVVSEFRVDVRSFGANAECRNVTTFEQLLSRIMIGFANA